MTTFNGEEFIYGYPKDELMLFALACREAGITNEKLHEINFNIEWAVDAVRKEVETVVKKNLDDIVNRIAEQTEPKPICESCSKNPCKKKKMINDIGHWVSECTEFDRKTDIGTSDTVYSDTAGYVPRVDMTDCSWQKGE